jgi:protein-tyrosine phosphatase
MPESVDAAAELGIDISGHIARRLLVSHVGSSDVVIGIASEHREAVVRAMPDAAPRTFTLKELVRLLEAQPVATASRDPGAQLLARVAAADELRRSGFEGNPNDEDVVDPLGQPLESYRAIAWELEEWCSRLADGLFGKAAAPARTGAEG